MPLNIRLAKELFELLYPGGVEKDIIREDMTSPIKEVSYYPPAIDNLGKVASKST